MMGRNPSNVQYFFPKLGWNEILKCLNELGITISKEELTKPDEHKDSVRRLLECLAEICTGSAREEWSQPGFAGLNAINYPELHEDSIPHLNSLRAIMKMMEVCEVRDFALKDIVAPTAERLNRQLSGIINFCKFREERLMLLTELNTNRSVLLDSLAQQQEKNEVLNNRLTLLRGQTAEEGEQIVALETDIKDMNARLNELRRKHESLESKIAQDQDTFNKLSAKVEEGKATHDALHNDMQRLSAQVVTSPEKFRKQIIEVGQTLQHEQHDAKVADKKVRELLGWVSSAEDAQSEVGAALEHITDIRGEVEKQKAIITDLDNTKQSVVGFASALSELQQNVAQGGRAAQRAEDKLAALRKTSLNRAEEHQIAADSLHTQLVEAEAFRVQVRTKAEKLETEVRRVDKEVEAEAAVLDAELSEVNVAYHQLERKVVRHLQNFNKALETTALNGEESKALNENVSPTNNIRVVA